MINRTTGLLFASIALATTGATHAATLTLSYGVSSGNNGASASFLFDDVSNTMKLTLTNTGTANNATPWLTGVFYNLSKNGSSVAVTLATNSVALASGSSAVWNAGNAGGALVAYGGSFTPGNMWGYQNNATVASNTYTNALSCVGAVSGFSIINPTGAPGNGLDGDGGGLLASGQTSVPGHGNAWDVFYRDSLVFTYSLGDFDLANDLFDVNGVTFAWNSDFAVILPATVVPVPLPVALAGAGLVLGGLLRRRLKK
jgi:hypothetical protein